LFVTLDGAKLRSHMRIVASAIALVGVFVACSTTTIVANSVGLTVDSASSPATVKSAPPASDRTYLQLDVTLRNVSSSKPISAGFELFSLTTDKSLVLTTSVVSGLVDAACLPDTSVAMGGQFSCTLVFEVPTSQIGKRLSYDDHLGHVVSAPLPPPPTTCEQMECYYRTAAFGSACYVCLHNRSGDFVAKCQNEHYAKVSACEAGGQCVCTDPPNGPDDCTCFAKECTGPAECVSAVQTYFDCAVQACGSICRTAPDSPPNAKLCP
jgi:Domain of unknown function (DUF4352)